MSEYSEEFFAGFDYLMSKYKEYLPRDFPDRHYVEPDDIIKIIEGMKRGEKRYISRLSEVEYYLRDILDELYYRHDDMHNHNSDDYYFGREIYEKELEIIDIIERLLSYTEMHPVELFGIISSDEKIGLKSVAQQKNLPREMEMEISDYVGINPKGGRKTNKKRDKKRKTKRNKKKKRIIK